MLEWFDVSEVDAFAQSLVAEVARRIPPQSIALEERKAPKKIGRMTEVLSEQVRAFVRSHRLNVYKRARLGNRMKWGLKDAGYPETFVDAFTYELITLLAVAARAR